MGVNKLLINVPTGIRIHKNRELIRSSVMHTRVMNIVGGMFSLAILGIAINKFPITFGGKRLESRAYPDYKSGKVFTLYKRKQWSMDYI